MQHVVMGTWSEELKLSPSIKWSSLRRGCDAIGTQKFSIIKILELSVPAQSA